VVKKALLITGMPGAGKSIISEIARRMGVPVYTLGDFIRREAVKRNLALTDEELGRLAVKLREEMGKGAVAILAVKEFAKEGVDICLIDGVRSLEEVRVFREYFNEVVIIAVHASPKTRFTRLARRGRPDDPKTWDEFVRRDYRELGFGIGNVIALADVMLVNEGDINTFKEECMRTLRRILG